MICESWSFIACCHRSLFLTRKHLIVLNCFPWFHVLSNCTVSRRGPTATTLQPHRNHITSQLHRNHIATTPQPHRNHTKLQPHDNLIATILWRKTGRFWNVGKKRERARRSRIFPMVFRLDIGLKFARCDFGKPGFISRGEISASLNLEGKVAWVKDRFVRDEDGKSVGTWFQKWCRAVIKRRWFVWHWSK